MLEKQGYDIVVENAVFDNEDIQEVVNIEKAVENLKGEERIAKIKIRVNQGKFRKLLLNRYSSCVLCGLSQSDLLIASHIKSWSDSTADEKLKEDNGLLLCPNHDVLFDKYYITFNEDGCIIIDSGLSESTLSLMNVNHSMNIKLYQGNLKYLEYHRALFYSKKRLV